MGDPRRLAAPLVHPAGAVLERGALPDAPLAARDRALCHGRARRRGGVLPVAHGRVGEPVRHAGGPAARGRRAQPAAAPPGDDDPPADALHGLRRLLDPVRLRDRGADHAAHGRRLDPRHAPLRARGLDLPRHRDHARRAVVLHRAGLGRLLGLGPGGERVAHALAGRHRVPALGHGPGEARDAEGLERVA